MLGKIVKQISNDYLVESNTNRIMCKVRGVFRNQKIIPLVGDNVLFDENKKLITEICERKNYLIRPHVANVDQVLIITSTKEPNFDSNLLDKLLCVITYRKILPIICFTKLDLLSKAETKEILKYKKYYEDIGYKVLLNTEISKIKEIFTGKVTVLTGQSGAGKSTLLNKLDKDLHIETNEISKALGRGKHTTRYTELIKIFNGLVADTPGFSSISFDGMSEDDIRNCFVEFNNYNCLYKDCKHDKESECNVKKALNDGKILESRYNNYLKFIERR